MSYFYTLDNIGVGMKDEPNKCLFFAIVTGNLTVQRLGEP